MPDYQGILNAYLSGSAPAGSSSSGSVVTGALETPLSLSDLLLVQQHLQESSSRSTAVASNSRMNTVNSNPSLFPSQVDPLTVLARQLLWERNELAKIQETMMQQVLAASMAPGLVQNQSSQLLDVAAGDRNQALLLLQAQSILPSIESCSPLLRAALRSFTGSTTSLQATTPSEPIPPVQGHKPQASFPAVQSSAAAMSPPTSSVAAKAAPVSDSTVHARVQSFREASDKIMVEQMLKRKTKREQFPERLHRILGELEEAGNSDIISFVKDGTAFAVHKPDDFETEVIPRYFRQQGISSFRKQLRLYGFTRLRTDTGALRGSLIFHHALFQKGKPELCVLMNRVDKKAPPPGATSMQSQKA